GSVTAIVCRDVLPALSPDDKAVFSPSASPEIAVEIHPSLESAPPWDGSTSRVRFHVSDAGALRPGDVGWVKIADKRREALVVPYAAVLEDDDGPYVLVVATDGRTQTKRQIEIGRVIGGTAVVVSGLRLNEHVL